jgi:hypothetical protein
MDAMITSCCSRKQTAADALLDYNAENDLEDNELYDAVETMLLRPIPCDVCIDQEPHLHSNNQDLAKKKRVHSGWATFLCDERFCVLPRDSLWYINNVKNPRVRATLAFAIYFVGDLDLHTSVLLSSTMLFKVTKHFCVGTTG